MRSSCVPVMTARLPPLISGSREQLQSTTIAHTRLRTHTRIEIHTYIRNFICECVDMLTHNIHTHRDMCKLTATANSKFEN